MIHRLINPRRYEQRGRMKMDWQDAPPVRPSFGGHTWPEDEWSDFNNNMCRRSCIGHSFLHQSRLVVVPIWQWSIHSLMHWNGTESSTSVWSIDWSFDPCPLFGMETPTGLKEQISNLNFCRSNSGECPRNALCSVTWTCDSLSVNKTYYASDRLR